MNNVQVSPKPIHNLPQLALVMLMLGALALAFSAIFVRLSEVGPTATAFWRMALSLPALWAWMTLEQQSSHAPRRPASSPDYRGLLLAGLFFAGDLAFWHWSIKFTTVANAVLLANFAPVFVTLGGWLFLRQRVSSTFVAGMLLALVGAMLLVGASFGLSLRHFIGDLLGLVTAVFYGGYILVVKQLRSHFSAATIMTWSGAVTSMVLLPVTLLAGEGLFPGTVWGWSMLLGLALFSHAAGQSLIAVALAHLPASFSSVTLLLQPVGSAVLAWLILSERLEPWQVLGGIIVLSGIFVARRGSRIG